METKVSDSALAQALRELTTQSVDEATFARAVMDADGHEGRLRSLYIRYRSLALTEGELMRAEAERLVVAELLRPKTSRDRNERWVDFRKCFPKYSSLTKDELSVFFQKFVEERLSKVEVQRLRTLE